MKSLYLKRSILCTLLIVATLSASSCSLITGTVRLAIALLPVKLALQCIPEGTHIDTPDGPKAIENLSPGDLVIGFDGQPVKVLQIHSYLEDSTVEGFRTVEFTNGAKVDLCDKHRIHGVRAESLQIGDSIKSGETVKSITTYDGVERSYDILTEDDGYQINNIPVNSMIEELYETGQTGVIRE